MKKLSKQAEKKTNGGKKVVSKIKSKCGTALSGIGSTSSSGISCVTSFKPIAEKKASPKLSGIKKASMTGIKKK